MRNGFKFNGRHTSEFGVTARTKSRPVIPAVKRHTLDLPYRDGEYDFSASNPDNREHFMNRFFTISLTVTADNLTELQGRIGKLSLWLSGSGELIFDDIPLIVWRGRISDEVIYMPERGGRQAQIDVSFRVDPFGKNIFGIEGPALDTAMPLDSNIPLTLEEKYIYTVTGAAELSVVNFGDRPARPIVTIEGIAGRFTMSLGEKSLSFDSSQSTTVDFDKQMVTNASGAAIKVTGEFFEFGDGANILNITSSNSNTLIVTVSYTPEYMYGADYSEIEWGEASA